MDSVSTWRRLTFTDGVCDSDEDESVRLFRENSLHETRFLKTANKFYYHHSDKVGFLFKYR